MNTTAPERSTCTVREAAARLGISASHAYELIRRKHDDQFIPGGVIRIGSRRVVISVAALERLLAGGTPSK
jgi:excisionase family DNA binding protein